MMKVLVKAVAAEQMHQRRSQMKKLIAHFAKDESGATAIEYGLIAAGISVAIIGALTTVGSSLTTMFGTVASSLN
jgi:pilus assembly protein Flp/PilA